MKQSVNRRHARDSKYLPYYLSFVRNIYAAIYLFLRTTNSCEQTRNNIYEIMDTADIKCHIRHQLEFKSMHIFTPEQYLRIFSHDQHHTAAPRSTYQTPSHTI
ncbi:uncharacterized protein BDW47DRAFT_97945 [Aspergillus candidus]|uniref:Uncharacterized protein n=1 Tax=Aspergillus candidus TaxID=41067 RepID=A0A2I2FNE6_ASPCN|nr:hypothetical protein BDW47DRAFT_97945 [Aspergillus candidus]PLB42146.1 hypothetical protein BDW47DRAFT_97945 [Aspergillus candidus]